MTIFQDRPRNFNYNKAKNTTVIEGNNQRTDTNVYYEYFYFIF